MGWPGPNSPLITNHLNYVHLEYANNDFLYPMKIMSIGLRFLVERMQYTTIKSILFLYYYELLLPLSWNKFYLNYFIGSSETK